MSQSQMKIAYIQAKFPVISEKTAVLNEIIELKRRKIDVFIFSSLKPTDGIAFEVAKEVIENTTYAPSLFSISSLRVNLYFIFTSPIRYFTTCMCVIYYNSNSFLKLLKAIYRFNNAVYFAKIIKDCGINHIHSHFATVSTMMAFVASMLSNVPFSFTAHAFDIFRDTKMLLKKIKEASFVRVISDYNKRYLIKLYGVAFTEKIKIIHCGINLDESINEYIDKEEILIFSVGRLVEKKGFYYLIKACKILTEKGYDFKCIIIGDGEEREELERLINDLNLENIVCIKGVVSQEELLKFYRETTIFVLPCVVDKNNDKDGIPATLMEAMAMKIPVVSTKISGIPELVEDKKTGLLVFEKDEIALSKAIEELIKNKELRKTIGNMGQEKVLKEFNIKTNIEKVIQMFRENSSS